MGPAGLTAAIYLVRYCRKIRVTKNGGSRRFPHSRTPQLSRICEVLGARHAAGLRTPAETYGVSIGHRRVYQLNLTSHSFGATAGGVEMQARRALLATCGRVLEIVIR